MSDACENNEAEDRDNECSADQFWDVISYGCHDKTDAFVTDDTVAPAFCYDTDNLRKMVKAGGSMRYPHNQIPMTDRDLYKLKPPKKYWEVWWSGPLNEIRGFLEATFSNDAVSPEALFKADSKLNNSVRHMFEMRSVLGTFDDALWKCEALDGTNGLIMAAESGVHEIVDLFIKKGVHLNSHDNQYNTALHKAVSVIAIASTFALHGHYAGRDFDLNGYFGRMGKANQVMLVLLVDETNVNAANNRGFTPLMIACGAGELAVHSFVNNQSPTKDARRILMRDERIDFNLSDNDGRTALHHACQRRISADRRRCTR